MLRLVSLFIFVSSSSALPRARCVGLSPPSLNIGAPAHPWMSADDSIIGHFGSATNASRGDEIVLILNTGGGTVTGYGLAAAQLERIKEAKLPLPICVEQAAPPRTAPPHTARPLQLAHPTGPVEQSPSCSRPPSFLDPTSSAF